MQQIFSLANLTRFDGGNYRFMQDGVSPCKFRGGQIGACGADLQLAVDGLMK
ncbi:MAG: hypothetical protein HGA71_03890 [Azonexaceae bacterium]|nr:hypothetical protein [Azonexaceae bacterium]